MYNNSKFIIVHPKHIFHGKYTSILMLWGVMGGHGVISSTGFKSNNLCTTDDILIKFYVHSHVILIHI